MKVTLEQFLIRKMITLNVVFNREVVDSDIMKSKNLEFPNLDIPTKRYEFSCEVT